MADSDSTTSPARVFISYARVDRQKVVPIGKLLEAKGFAVWLDTNIEGGAAFARAIAAELERAQVVVVAWSAASVNSNWVLDEASAARDSGRLVPLALDATTPPLGFRQFQAIDFSRWRGGAAAPEADAIIRALAAVRGGLPVAAPVAATGRLHRRWMIPALAGLALLLLAALGTQFLWPRTGTRAPQSIAVLPFADMSVVKNPAFSDGLAEEILDALARAPGIKVLGRTSAWSLRDRRSDLSLIRDKLGVGRILEGSVRQIGNRIKVSVRLIDTATGAQMWGQSFDRPTNDSFAVQEEIARAVAARVGAYGPVVLPLRKTSAVPGVYEKVITAKQLVRTVQRSSIERARVMLSEAISADPEYAPAHAALAGATIALWQADAGNMPFSIAFDQARSEAQRAIALDANLADGYSALGMSEVARDPPAAIRALSRAVALDPRDSLTRVRYANALAADGQLRAAIDQDRRGVELDPLWERVSFNLTEKLVAAGDVSEAKAVVARFRAISPDPAAADSIDANVARASGDYARALHLANRLLAQNSQLSSAEEIRSEVLQKLGAVDELKPSDTFWGGGAGRAVAQRRFGDAANILLKSGPAIWDEPYDSYLLSLALVQTNRSVDLVRLFSARFTSVDAYTHENFATETTALLLANALRRTGRNDDARLLRSFAGKRMARREMLGLAPAQNAALWAFLLAEQSDRAEAIRLMRAGVKAQWWAACAPLFLDNWLVPTGLMQDPSFAPIDAACRARRNEQRRLAGMPTTGA